jgi:threonine dehydrogenase-like Zn-dependent dehydrogenase
VPGEWSADNPGLTGHEVAGEIAAVGHGVDARLGQPVWIDPIAGCGQCSWCRDGRQTFCERVSIVCQGFAEYVVAPARQCRPVPTGFDYVTASLIPDMVGTPVGAVRRAGLNPGESVAVWGLGPVGLGLGQAAICAGATPVIGVDPVAARRDRACALGIVVIDAVEASAARLREVAGGIGPDVVLCSVASEGGARAAFESLRPDGRMVTVAGFPPAGGEERKWVSGSWGCDERLWPEAIEFVVSRRFVLDGYVTHELPLARVEEAFSIRADDLAGSFKVVVVPD